jgi:parallel beta-helix repeat protein
MHVVDGSVGSDLELFAGNCLEGALVIANHVAVADGATLTLNSGVVFKFEGPLNMTVNGTLSTGGTIPFPVVFTSLADDSVAGDTNNDGPSSGSPGEWIGLTLNPSSDASFLYGLEVRHAGHPFYAMAGITLSSSDTELQNCAIRDCAYAGIDLSNNSLPMVTGCTFQDNGGGAIRNAPIEAVPGFSGNASSGNAGGDCIDVSGDATVAWDLAISAANCPGGALVIGNHFGVVSGATWTLQEGVVLKVRGPLKAEIAGALQVNGTSASPVVITSIADDSVAGDTNKDGPSNGAPGDWIGMYFLSSSDASYANYLEVRHAGHPFYAAAGITLDRSDVQLSNCVFRDCAYAGLDLTSYGGASFTAPTVTDCSFVDNGGVAVSNVAIDAVPGFLGNSATGNGGNYLQITSASTVGDTAISAANCLGGALVIVGPPSVGAGVALALGPGVVLKNASVNTFNVHGSLDLQGTPAAPVVFTAFADDAFGGDTNGDGSLTLADKAAWGGIAYHSTTDASTADNVLIRYGGYNGAPGLLASSPLLTARSVRIEHCANDGFEAWKHAGVAQNWIAYDCDVYGIDLWSGSFDLRHATVNACGAGGINRVVGFGYTGQVVDAISWGNAGPNYVGVVAGELRYSDGDRSLAGAHGNIDIDPLFVDAAEGDLHLQPTSPCIDAGDPLWALDPDGTRTDMGAYAHDQCAPFTYCMPKPNPQGCAMALSFSGTPSTLGSEPFLISVEEAMSNKSGLLFYGKSGPALFPYQGGYFCAKGPFKRTPLQSSGGNPPPEDCSGSFSFDFNAWIQSGKDPFLVPGVTVNAQYWCRMDGQAGSLGLSDGIQFRICQ